MVVRKSLVDIAYSVLLYYNGWCNISLQFESGITEWFKKVYTFTKSFISQKVGDILKFYEHSPT